MVSAILRIGGLKNSTFLAAIKDVRKAPYGKDRGFIM
jgi:hypothetical protein